MCITYNRYHATPDHESTTRIITESIGRDRVN